MSIDRTDTEPNAVSDSVELFCPLRIVFWNVRKKALTSLIGDLVLEVNADVVILLECSAPTETTLGALRSIDNQFFVPRSIGSRFQCFSRVPNLDLTEIHNGFRISARKLHLGSTCAMLVLVHGVDIRNYSSEERISFAHELSTEIRFVRSEHKVDKLILLGDFNMNPFDSGMNLAAGLNAMMTKNCVSRGYRTHLARKYDFYYNPMWSLLGDRSRGPAGTIYDTSSQGPYGWSMLDQVILSHTVLDNFEDVHILTCAGSTSLIDSYGRPDKSVASDHLPILVELKTTEHE